MTNIKPIPGATKLMSQIARMTPEQITHILPRDFLTKVQAALAKPAKKSNITRGRSIPKRVRLEREEGVGPVKAREEISPANAEKRRVGVGKACNSFMCFRSYYKVLLQDLPQKEASPYLTLLWKGEPFKAKWTMIAKAYSTIRDTVGKSHAPLGRYLEKVCPRVGIIEPGEYFSRLRWEVTWIGQQRFLQQRGQAELPLEIQTTFMSERDIVALCLDEKYITAETPNFKLIELAVAQGNGMQFTVLSAKEACTESAKMDPRSFVARALGIDPEHPFIELSTSLDEKLELDDGTDFVEMLKKEGIIEGEKFEYEWSSNLTKLFSRKEMALDLEMIGGPTDISEPLGFDSALVEGGASEKVLTKDDDEDLPEHYNFWESF